MAADHIRIKIVGARSLSLLYSLVVDYIRVCVCVSLYRLPFSSRSSPDSIINFVGHFARSLSYRALFLLLLPPLFCLIDFVYRRNNSFESSIFNDFDCFM